MKKLVFCFSLCGFVLSGCKNEPSVNPDEDRQVVINFSASSLSASLLKSDATSDEKSISKIILFGIKQGNSLEKNYPAIEGQELIDALEGEDVKRTISKNVKTLYAIANPSATLETAAAGCTDLSGLLGLTESFVTAPTSNFLMGGKGDVDNKTADIELVRAVAKIEIISGSTDFTITSVTVQNTPNQGFVFQQETAIVPTSATTIYPLSTNTTLYVAESAKGNPVKFAISGSFNGEDVNFPPISLTIEGKNIDIVRNTHYKVSVTPKTTDECSITISIRGWGEPMVTDPQEIDFDNL